MSIYCKRRLALRCSTEKLVSLLVKMDFKREHIETAPITEKGLVLIGYENKARLADENAPESDRAHDVRPCHVVIRKRGLAGASNDLGFRWNKETESWDLEISDYDTSVLNGGHFERDLNREYAMEQINAMMVLNQLGGTSMSEVSREETSKEINGKLVRGLEITLEVEA